ncbi:OmpP1/FadL family transporter [Desulfobulbus alkaliphilus]|uniref:OmpP1/FadL family transporter n=1 Tax=Desulfobulbus alkaliphilus TaxID=869814 RepID=UPI0019662450|nr:outer membrane protein transport protein [Desulfobulbus alkaliphilus]MBM9538376.1 outer membrane protein transport protein [Desulfobulbus alkaliphilus]
MTEMKHDLPRQQQKKIGPLLMTILLLVAVIPLPATAAGFRITNQSLGAVGLSGARTAYTPGPDASYYNPANMHFSADQWQVETSLTMLDLPTITYRDHRSPLLDASSESERFFMPLVHAVSPAHGALRFGFSLTYPYGLAKKWQQPLPRASAQRFSLFVVEANPSVAFAPLPWLSLGGGVRVVHGRGEVDTEVLNPPFDQLAPLTSLSRSSDGTDTRPGYNLAMTIQPHDRLAVAATFRSEINLDLEGTSTLRAQAGSIPLATYSGPGSVGITLPAVLSLAAACTFDRLTVELGWDRTFWSSFTTLDFTYEENFLGTVFDGFDRPVPKNWQDSDAYRLGLTYAWDHRWTSTLGFAYDRTPVPAATLGFELPDADALIYSAGIRYRYSPGLELGLSYMYHYTKSRSVTNNSTAGLPGIDGTFTDGGAHALTLGLVTTF